jgi:hypothetical protein
MRRIAVLTLSLFFTFGAFADVVRKGFTVADGGTLRLDGAYGNIKIVTGGSGVAVEVTRDAKGKSAERRLAEHKITFAQSGNDVVIRSDFDDDRHMRWFGWDDDDYDVQWNIRVPDHYNVDVSTSGGWIEVDAIEGTVEARTSGGSIHTGRLGGKSSLDTSGGSITVDGAAAELEVHTSGGSITIGDTNGPVVAKTSGGSIALARINGDVVARTSGGGIKIEDAAGSVDASTSGGSITARLSRQPSGDSKLSTSGGGVVVSLAPSIAVDLDAQASGGGVTSDVPITVQGTQDDDSLRGKINGGGPRLVLRSSGGGVRVRPL